MKPLNKRVMLPKRIEKHLEHTSEKKLIPDTKWQSLKASAAVEAVVNPAQEESQ